MATPAPSFKPDCDCSEINADGLSCWEGKDNRQRIGCTSHATQEECAGSDGQYRGDPLYDPNTCKWYGAESGDGDGGAGDGDGGGGGDGAQQQRASTRVYYDERESACLPMVGSDGLVR